MKLSTELLTGICESISTGGSLARAAKAVQIAESTLFLYITRSKAAQKINDTSSPLHFMWRDALGFLHEHIRRAKAECVAASVFQAIEQNRMGVEEVVYDPSTGRPVIALNPAYIGLSDDEMRERGLHPQRDRLMWNYDELTGEPTTPVYQVRVNQIPASLRAKILSGIAPTVFGERADVNVNHRGAVVHVVEPARYIPRAEREAQGEVVDAQFSEVAAKITTQPRVDIELLKAEAARLEREGPTHSKPQGIVKDAYGRPVGSGVPKDDKPDDQPLHKPETTLRDNPRAYEASRPAPSPQRVYSEFPRHADPRRPGAMARRII